MQVVLLSGFHAAAVAREGKLEAAKKMLQALIAKHVAEPPEAPLGDVTNKLGTKRGREGN